MENKYKIAIIYSTYPEMTSAVRDLIAQKDYILEVRECVFDRAVKEAKKFEKKGFDLIISRGVTGMLIKKAVSIPVILVEITNFDIINTLYKASKMGKKIAYFEYISTNHYHDFESMREILNLDENQLGIYYYNSEKELREKVKEAFNSDVDVVVASGMFVLEMARMHGMKSIMVHSTKEAVFNAFRQAEDILQIRTNDRKIIDSFNSVMNHLSAGVIVVDKNKLLTHLNYPAEKILGIKREDYLGEDIQSIEHPEIRSLFSELDKPAVGLFRNINNIELMVNIIPLVIESRYIGTAVTFETARQIQKLEAKIRNELYNKGFVARYHFSDLVGKSEAINRAITKAKSFGNSDSTVLITGESGTGKEIFANSIHNVSQRAGGPFVAVNCATLPENLLESELFGYDEGSFTGAKKGGKPGLFELAHKGTIFLDEISEISLSIQARLLRVLQEKAIRRVGGDKIIPVDVRVIAATNATLQQKVKSGEFREDLFFRLNVLNLHIPPLRERVDDIIPLIKYFYKKYSPNKNFSLPVPLIEELKKYPWPGNVRELESFVEKYVILADSEDQGFFLLDELYSDLTFFDNRDDLAAKDERTLVIKVGTLEEMEKQIIAKMQTMFGQDKARLAEKLGICRTTLWKKLKKI